MAHEVERPIDAGVAGAENLVPGQIGNGIAVSMAMAKGIDLTRWVPSSITYLSSKAMSACLSSFFLMSVAALGGLLPWLGAIGLEEPAVGCSLLAMIWAPSLAQMQLP